MKRCVDLFLCLLLMLFISPILLLVTGVVYLKMGRPVFFVQPRVGNKNIVFNMIKFRTMKNLFASDGTPLSDSDRLTKFGLFLRSSSLDELPELWNVLRGDMSLVGPRPLLIEYLPLYNSEQSRRHTVRPGITGWAQVNGRNALTWEEKFKLDIWYVENRTLWLDLKIIFLTVKKVLVRDGISADGEATMPKFTGSQK